MLDPACGVLFEKKKKKKRKRKKKRKNTKPNTKPEHNAKPNTQHPRNEQKKKRKHPGVLVAKVGYFDPKSAKVPIWADGHQTC